MFAGGFTAINRSAVIKVKLSINKTTTTYKNHRQYVLQSNFRKMAFHYPMVRFQKYFSSEQDEWNTNGSIRNNAIQKKVVYKSSPLFLIL